MDKIVILCHSYYELTRDKYDSLNHIYLINKIMIKNKLLKISFLKKKTVWITKDKTGVL